MLRELTKNPIAIIALAGLAGWLLGSGVFALPGLGAPAPATPASAAPAPSSLPASNSAAATIATTSASMPSPGLAPDPWGSFDL